jgi:methylene-fatty-acyl-phospholipid synthase
MAALDFLTLLCIASPHILYAAIWYLPEIWRAQFGRESVQVFAHVATAGKVLQFTAAYLWLETHSGSYTFFSITRVPLLVWPVCLTMVGIGQVLNVAIYNAIGRAGVYYGFKLGSPVPWHTGFPFNVVSHPQYVGSVLTVWGLGGIVWSQAPAGFPLLLVYWTVLYVLTGLQEQYT